MRSQDPAEALLDLLDEENLGVSTVGLGTNTHTLPAFVAHPFGMIGSDAILFGEYPNPAPTAASPSCWRSSSAPSATCACRRRSAR